MLVYLFTVSICSHNRTLLSIIFLRLRLSKTHDLLPRSQYGNHYGTVYGFLHRFLREEN